MIKDEQTVTLSKPINYEDKSYNELTLDLESLTGDDLINADDGKAAVPEFSKAYLAKLAAKAAGVPEGVIRKANAKEFTEITVMVQNFLIR